MLPGFGAVTVCGALEELLVEARLLMDSVHRGVRRYSQEIAITLALALTAGFASYLGARLVDPVVFSEGTSSSWFEADIPRVFQNMTQRQSDHKHTQVHPLFPLLAYPPTHLLRKLGIEATAAVRTVIAIVSSLWIAALFALLRLAGCRRVDATLFTVLAATSAAAMIWSVVPETHIFGSLSVLLALLIAQLSRHRRASALWYALVSALTLSFTATNWVAGIVATIVRWPWRRALQITVAAFCLVVLLWGVQKLIFPSAEFLLGGNRAGSLKLPRSGHTVRVLRALVYHTMVMPSIEELDRYGRPEWPVMSVQNSLPGSGSFWGIVAVLSWTALLGLGLWGCCLSRHSELRIVLAFTLFGQLTLHVLFGTETFLYAPAFLPLLITLAAFSTLTPVRSLALVLASVLVVTATINNTMQFNHATEFYREHGIAHMTPPPGKRLDLAPLATRYHGGVDLGFEGALEMYWAGRATAPYDIPSGTYMLRVRARGQQGCDLWPILRLRADGQEIGAQEVASAATKNYEFPGVILSGEGPHTVGIEFGQPGNCNQPGQDVNLFIQGIYYERTGDAPAPTPTPMPSPTPYLGETLDLASLATNYHGGVALGDDGGLAMYWAERATAPYEIPPGTYTFRARARGQKGCDLWPVLKLHIDGHEIGAQEVANPATKLYEFPGVILSGEGPHTLGIEFVQPGNCNQPGQDVNLFIGAVYCERTGEAASTTATPAG